MGSTELLIVTVLFLAGFWAVAYAWSRYDTSGWYPLISGAIAGWLVFAYLLNAPNIGLFMREHSENDRSFASICSAMLLMLLSGIFCVELGKEVKRKRP